MTDAELIARLREARKKQDEFEAVMLSDTAADRIEAMIAERDEAERREKLAADKAVEYLDRAEAAEAKLEKAVGALEEISEYDTGATAGLAYTAKHHLAEIKGESHE